ncbi:hypothetical protein GCM10011514_08090 [Emticicia aquatilis]|uniref:Uncharacterized protein n=1 Tax=Emticicia aquatilis TaxID=1537369 RepID=A0A917DK25_9BACT|nr:hypothetical protein [Emticicia aquatilis]GGD46424.1 hypothetical protein GCM10011514_08090 [Emticicia aquatilis]
MKNNIQTIDDLKAERARLHNQMQLSKIGMKNDIAAIKEELNPARQAVGVLNDVFTSPKKGLLTLGIGLGVDVVLRRTILARAGWLPRLVVPFLVRNAATNMVQKNGKTIVEKGLIWLKNVTEKPITHQKD